MSNLHKAILLASEKHINQSRWNGDPYILHPLRVMFKMNTEEEKIVAVLHDIIEDTDVTEQDLIEAGFDKVVVNAIVSITNEEDESYEDYIMRCRENYIGRKVKREDIQDNLNVPEMLQMKRVDDKHKDRINKYLWAIEILS